MKPHDKLAREIRDQLATMRVIAALNRQFTDHWNIAERAALAIRCMTSVTDPDADHQVYWLGELWHDPPGRNYPCYQLAHCRANTTRWEKATRFVADHILA